MQLASIFEPICRDLYLAQVSARTRSVYDLFLTSRFFQPKDVLSFIRKRLPVEGKELLTDVEPCDNCGSTGDAWLRNTQCRSTIATLSHSSILTLCPNLSVPQASFRGVGDKRMPSKVVGSESATRFRAND